MKTIFVALDASAVAPNVLEHAVALARATQQQLVLFRAVSLPVDLPLEAFAEPQDRLLVTLQQRARRDLEAYMAMVPRELLADVKVAIGVPWQAICEGAAAEQASLIIIGSHGHRLIDRILGTTAKRVVDHADRPVLVVKPTPAGRDRAHDRRA
jgi:nucleotide-binding universal stress UspA family protein